jgi:predicted lipoprotein with Yx(FWY)xxD motif
MFTHDRRNTDTCVHISGCAATWPPLYVSGSPSAGAGVKRSLLGTIAVGHRRQVTYAGHPLYTYTGASGPGDASYAGVSLDGGKWDAVTASGGARS